MGVERGRVPVAAFVRDSGWFCSRRARLSGVNDL